MAACLYLFAGLIMILATLRPLQCERRRADEYKRLWRRMIEAYGELCYELYETQQPGPP